jgi:hypothetical protein
MLDDGPIARELLGYSKKAAAKLSFRLQLARNYSRSPTAELVAA